MRELEIIYPQAVMNLETMLIAFDSTQQALRTEMLLEYADVDIDIRPTPKEITAGCALSIDFPAGEFEKVKEIIQSEDVEIRGIFRQLNEAYELIFSS